MCKNRVEQLTKIAREEKFDECVIAEKDIFIYKQDGVTMQTIVTDVTDQILTVSNLYDSFQLYTDDVMGRNTRIQPLIHIRQGVSALVEDTLCVTEEVEFDLEEFERGDIIRFLDRGGARDITDGVTRDIAEETVFYGVVQGLQTDCITVKLISGQKDGLEPIDLLGDRYHITEELIEDGQVVLQDFESLSK